MRLILRLWSRSSHGDLARVQKRAPSAALAMVLAVQSEDDKLEGYAYRRLKKYLCRCLVKKQASKRSGDLHDCEPNWSSRCAVVLRAGLWPYLWSLSQLALRVETAGRNSSGSMPAQSLRTRLSAVRVQQHSVHHPSRRKRLAKTERWPPRSPRHRLSCSYPVLRRPRTPAATRAPPQPRAAGTTSSDIAVARLSSTLFQTTTTRSPQ
jgi:hypothetical protein